MTQEEKAKRYDEVLHKAKNYYSTTDSSSDIKLIGLIFPELKESDDEKIRKALVEMVHDTTGDSLWIDYNVHKEDALAWLEKQGEHANFRNKIRIGDKVTRNEDGVLVNLSQLKRVAKKDEKQGEQKPVPKFKVGDTMRTLQEATDGYTDGMPVVASIDEEYYHCNNELIAIKDQDDYEYPPMNRRQKPTDKVEPKFKVGDTVTVKPMSCHGKVFKGEPFKIVDIIEDNYVSDDGKTYSISLQDGWELVEQKSWSEEDEYCIHQLIVFCENCVVQDDGAKRCAHWLKDLKERVLPQKPEWSKEDEEIIHCLEYTVIHFYEDEDTINRCCGWLKSLRPQNHWKPSKGQLECLGYAIEKAEKDWSPLTNNRVYLTLKALKEQLLELRESKV